MLLSNLRKIENGRVITNDSFPEMTFQGIKISVENPKGSVRKGEDDRGDSFKTKMFYPYGFIQNTEGVDGDEIDVFVGPDKDSSFVFIVHARNTKGEFDEDKVMLGFADKLHARDAFLGHYDSAEHLGPITEMSLEEFKLALKNHKPGSKLI